MNRPRFYDFRSSLGPGAVGLCSTDLTTLLAYANEAEQRLIEDPNSPEDGWFGSEVRMVFNVSRTEPSIVAPQNIARIMAMDVCKHPIRINNQWYEYLEFGPGHQPKGCTNANGASVNPWCQGTLMAYERETVTTFAPLVGTKYIRAYVTDPSDLQRTAIIQGKDSNGQVVRFLDALANSSGIGEKITFQTPFTDTENQFTGELIGIQKQKTFGEVQFFQVDPTTGEESALLVMGPSETTASFRKYFINGLPKQCCNVPQGTPVQVIALCKLDFVPLTCDSDYLNLHSVPALIDACQWIRMSRMDVPGAQQMAEIKHQSALRLLYGKLQHYFGNVNPAIQRRILGSDRIRPQHI